MPKTPLPMDKIRDKVKNYLDRVNGRIIEHDKPSALVLAPVETISKFIPVEDLPDQLPVIPEKLRDFAFRYATEYKPTRFWAKEYGVAQGTILRWLQKHEVQSYIAVTRYERRMFNFAMIVQIERNTYKALNEILNVKMTADTIAPKLQAVKFAWTIVNRPEEAGDRAKGTLNLNIGYGAEPSGNGENPYRSERNVTPKDLEDAMIERGNLLALANEYEVDISDIVGDGEDKD